MPDRPLPTCHLVGGDSLLMECGERLLARGFSVRGVVTRARRVRDWAAAHGLPCHDLDGDWQSELAREPFDHLLAITHLELLPAEVLALPRRGAINFHDGPLPGYAGLFCPVWALLAGEERYGVTWHRVDAGIDSGDVLERESFDVASDETSLSLNTKCFEAGLASFERVMDRLERGDDAGTPQGSERSRLCLRNERPDGGGLLDWNRPAHELERLVRALDFGAYPNPFAAAKLLTERGVFLVREARAVEHGEDGARPGQVLAAGAGSLRVACADGALEIRALGDPQGADVELSEPGLEAGEVLPRPADEVLERLDALTERTAGRREEAMIRLLETLEPVALPHVPVDAPAGSGLGARTLALPELGTGDPSRLVAAAFPSFLARLTGQTRFDLALRHPDLDDACAGLDAWWSARVPLRLELEPEQDLAHAAEALEAAIRRAVKRGPSARDVIARTPSLHENAELTSGRLLPLGLALGGAESDAPVGDVLTLRVDPAARTASLVFDRERVGSGTVERVAEQFETFLAGLAARPDARLTDVRLVSDAERSDRAAAWEAVDRGGLRETDPVALIEAQVTRSPQRTALLFEGASLTYAELDERANRLAHELLELGVDATRPVGLHLERDLDLVVALLAVWKAGAAYLPLDPEYPKNRLEWMLADSGARHVVTTGALERELEGARGTTRLRLDLDAERIAARPAARPRRSHAADGLAYVIYTSGSTGRPKGVCVEARNVASFFRGMDERVALPADRDAEPGTWCAMTSLSFDISVLELAWTLSRGFRVLVHKDRTRQGLAGRSTHPASIDFSMFLWGNDDGPGSQKYRLTLEAARFADERGFRAVWTPERHFHAFGGPFPNPSVISAAIAATTSRVEIRAGSVVLPLHHPIRVAEEWSLVDNLSDGRVGMAFASGWQPDDFVLVPENFARNKEVMLENIEVVRRLWRGEKVAFENPFGEQIERETLPRPIQPELPFWITSAGNPETYRIAGQTGANVLTHLLGQSIDDVAEKIRIYREARAEAGFDPATGVVTLMLHTFVGDDVDEVRETVRGPLKSYLDASVGLVKKYAWSFPAFAKRGDSADADLSELDLDGLSPEEQDAVLEHAFQRYFESSGLFGTPESCLARVDRLKEIGVDEIGCLIDYGVPTDVMLASLERLAELLDRSQPAAPAAGEELSLAAQLERHGVTHLQCTPSMARMLLADPASRSALGRLEHLLVGGEATPSELARELRAAVRGRFTNMYGPTETTVWSTTWEFPEDIDVVSIGTPIANTAVYVLDRWRRALPTGVPGELWIGGDGVVRGYHGRPDLTDERFVADPFRPGNRMYRTGDVAFFHADGSLGFLGRTDHQVKVRGHRIELGEIESVLLGEAGVREAVAIAREDEPGDVRLVAYVVATAEAFDEMRAKAAVRARCPEYMVPARIARLDALPLTPNGKLDRGALPRPEELESREVVSAPPEDGLEQQLAELWTRILGLESVGREDNFFELGGHSLLVVKLHRDLAAALERPVSLTDLYRFPTIRGLAEFLSGDGDGEAVERSARRGQSRRSALAARGRRGARRPTSS